MSLERKTPVAVYAYNRPGHLDRTLRALWQCSRRYECDFYFFSDGAKSPTHVDAVSATRSVLREWAGRFGAAVIEREANLGLATSVCAGVDELCRRYGRVVVVEDDLVVRADFLHFMIESLDHYENANNVFQVAGCTLSPPTAVDTDVFLLPVTSTWGWGTWARAWKHFDAAPPKDDAMSSDPQWLDWFNLGHSRVYSDMLSDRLAGRNDSWGILWWYAVAKRRGLVAYPRESLVWNGGFDGSGVHCGTSDLFSGSGQSTLDGEYLPARLTFPTDSTVVQAHLQQLRNYINRFASSSAVIPPGPMRSGLRTAVKTLRRMFRNARP